MESDYIPTDEDLVDVIDALEECKASISDSLSTLIGLAAWGGRNIPAKWLDEGCRSYEGVPVDR